MTKCWKPRCRRDATVTLTGDGWTVASCTRHEDVARYVTGCRPARGRSGQMALPLGGEL